MGKKEQLALRLTQVNKQKWLNTSDYTQVIIHKWLNTSE